MSTRKCVIAGNVNFADGKQILHVKTIKNEEFYITFSGNLSHAFYLGQNTTLTMNEANMPTMLGIVPIASAKEKIVTMPKSAPVIVAKPKSKKKPAPKKKKTVAKKKIVSKKKTVKAKVHKYKLAA